jgi:hypothetical protein
VKVQIEVPHLFSPLRVSELVKSIRFSLSQLYRSCTEFQRRLEAQPIPFYRASQSMATKRERTRIDAMLNKLGTHWPRPLPSKFD